MTPAAFAVVTLAAYRLAVSVTTDEVTAPLRQAVADRWPARDDGPSLPVRFINCGRCVSFWTALGCTAIAWSAGYVTGPAAAAGCWLAAAGVCLFAIRAVP